MLQLRNIWFNWENSFFDKGSGEHLEILETFNILSELTLARRTKRLHATTEMCVFQFHRQLLENLHANHTTPLFLATVLSMKSEIAQLLYPRLDLLLADKKHYERRTKELFEDLGLEAETYRHRSARKRVLEKALEELRGAPLSTGCIVAATIEPTKDDSDFKLVVHKGPRHKSLALPKPKEGVASSTPKTASQTSLFDAPSVRAEPAEPEEAALVRYFHQQFHGASLKGPMNPKELVSAARLIQAHGPSKARALVDYAKSEASKTNYAPASLNGILQYEPRFESEHTAQERATKERRDQQEQRKRTQEAQEARQRVLLGELMERVGETKKHAPQAFTAFLRRVETKRDEFLNTPIARQASASLREVLSRAYEQPAKRLEIFLDFFSPGSDGEVLLSISAPGQDISRWIHAHGEAVRPLLEATEWAAEDAEMLR